MDLRQLRYFVGIVQAGGLSRAADHLHVAQSAISHHLASLEAEIGKQLVTRGPKGIALTEAGTVLYRHAEAILRHVEFAKQDAISALAVPSGSVAVGFPTALSGLLSYELFIRVRDAYPQILLHLLDGNSSLLRELLDNGRLDIAVLFSGQQERGLAVEPLLLEELFYVTAEPDPDAISLSEAAQRPLLLPGQGSGIQLVAQEAFRQRGLSITTIGEIDTLATLKRAVAAGAGNTILPWSALYEEGRKPILNHRSFKDARLERPVALCFSEVAQRSLAFQAVASVLRALIRELADSGRWQGISLLPGAIEASLSPVPP
jgi:LysR family nitrogen assimilation transcriptional regulator